MRRLLQNLFPSKSAVLPRHFFGWGGRGSLIIFFFLFSNSLVAQNGVEITSTATSPTQQNPIEVFLKFKDAVNKPISGFVDLTNASVISEERLIPEFENFDHFNLPTQNIQASLQDFSQKYALQLLLGGDFATLLQEYLTEKFKNLIVAFDINSTGEIYYLTFANGVFKYNENSPAQQVIPPSKFKSPIDILIDNEDRILVADNDAYAVKVFSPSNYAELFIIGGNQGADGNEFYGPTGLAKNNNNDIYVVDTYPGVYNGNDDPTKKVVDKIKVYRITDDNFSYINFFGKYELDDPFRLAIDSNNNVYVSDSGGTNGRIRIFDSTGNLQNTIASGSGNSPASIAVDSFGYIYVADYNGDITFNGIYQNPLDLLSKFDVIKGKTYSIDVYKPLSAGFETEILTTFDKNLKLPLDLTLNYCENILVLDLDFSGQISNANFDFDVEVFRRNDRFKLLLEPQAEGLVKLEVNFPNLFKCGPQPEGIFSIEYATEEVNSAPVAAADTYSVQQDQVLTVPVPGVLSNDSDAENDPLTAVLRSNVSHGTLSLNPDGSFVYSPAAGYIGTDTFNYVASDGEDVSGEVTVTINVTASPNAAPVAAADTYSTQQDQVLTVPVPGVLSNDSDTENDPLTAVLQSDVSHGTLSLNPNGSFVYTPTAGYTGQDSFTYVASDGKDVSGEVTVTININSTPVPTFSCSNSPALNLSLDASCDYPETDFSYLLSDFQHFQKQPFFEQTEVRNENALEVEIKVYDGQGGNFVGQCDFEVRLTDEILPIASCVAPFSIELDENGIASLDPKQIGAGSTDNCGIEKWSLNKQNFTTADIGQHQLTLTVEDASGNENSCFTTVTVEPYDGNSGGEISCPDPLTKSLNQNGEFTVVLFLSGAGNAQVEYELSQEKFTCEDIGTHTVTVNYSGDLNGTCSFQLTIVDDMAPQANCISEMDLVLDATGRAQLTAGEVDRNSTDNCSIESMVLSKTEFTTADIGVKEVDFTVTDEYGNEDKCVVKVNVKAFEQPSEEITCVEKVELNLDENGRASLNPRNLFGGGTGTVQYSVSKDSFTCLDKGEQTVIFSYNTPEEEGSCEIKVVIRDPLKVCDSGPDEPEKDSFVILYPNPNKGVFVVRASQDIEIERAEVFDSRGRYLLSRDFREENINGPLYHFDLSYFQSDIYTVVLYSAEKKYIRRAIIKNEL